ncbi:hypothetical protein PMAYCL1PPCAC_32109, partial [Pristionchus mayeri]
KRRQLKTGSHSSLFLPSRMCIDFFSSLLRRERRSQYTCKYDGDCELNGRIWECCYCRSLRMVGIAPAESNSKQDVASNSNTDRPVTEQL